MTKSPSQTLSGTLLGVLEITRAPLAPTAISNIWMITFWTLAFEPSRAIGRFPMPAALALTAGVAIGLWSFGMSLNDIMDQRRDRLFKRDRPLPAGRLEPTQAMATALFALLLALFCAALIGAASTLMCLLCAALIVVYNTAGKHLPAVGLTLLALIRASHMLIANPLLRFTWPVWAVFTFVLLISGIAYVLEHKRPRLYPQEVWGLVFGWVIFSLLFISWMVHRGGLREPGAAMIWLGPVVAGAMFAGYAPLMVKSKANRRAAGNALMTQGLMWLIVIDASWLIGAGMRWQPAALIVLYVISRASIGVMRRYREGVVEREGACAA